MPRHADAIAAERYRLDEHRKTSLYKHKPQAAPQKSRRSRLTTGTVANYIASNYVVANNPAGRTRMVKAGGNWVDGDRFFDRETELEALRERIGDGTHTLLTAQRPDR